jgi:hypothetical protein
MLTRSIPTSAWKAAVQQMDLRNQIHFHPSPVRKLSTTGPAHLKGQKLDGAVVNPIIVRLDDTWFVLINKSN